MGHGDQVFETRVSLIYNSGVDRCDRELIQDLQPHPSRLKTIPVQTQDIETALFAGYTTRPGHQFGAEKAMTAIVRQK
jgi:hypothetical protein